jgi:hypothetical protein
MDYANIQTTIFELRRIKNILSDPKNYRDIKSQYPTDITLNQAIEMVGIDETNYSQNLNEDGFYPGDLERGKVPEIAWFVREAIRNINPGFTGLIFEWNAEPARTHQQILDVVASASRLAFTELEQILESEESCTLSDTVLHRWANPAMGQLCAMTALSKELGYKRLTDMPKEVDPGLAALINLLNDRANDKSRQLLSKRLRYVPNTGPTDICLLIAKVLVPVLMETCSYEKAANLILECKDRSKLSGLYASLSKCFLGPDNMGIFAIGCTILSVALRTKDFVEQDLLAVAAASQFISYEVQWGWVQTLEILDFIIGLEEKPCLPTEQSSARYKEYFSKPNPYSEMEKTVDPSTDDARQPHTEVHSCGIKVQWFPALADKFVDQLDEIAKVILDEVTELGCVDVYMHTFPFKGENIIIITSWDQELDMLSADADLMAYQDVCGDFDIEGDGTRNTVLMPVPASKAETVH